MLRHKTQIKPLSARMLNATMPVVASIAVGVAASIAVTGPATQLNAWGYGTGIAIIRNLYVPSIVVAALTILAFFVSLFTARHRSVVMFLAANAVTGAALVPYMFEQRLAANPFIHDITTDFDSPPQIEAAADLPRKNPATYVGAETAPKTDITIAEAQKAAFSDIQPVVVGTPMDDVAQASRKIIEEMNMDVLNETQDGKILTIEAAFTSFWFGFVDDFVVRIQPSSDDTRIDVRSKSRVGVSDLAANAQRVRTFASKLKDATR